MTPLTKIENLLRLLPHWIQVQFALTCSLSVEHLANDKRVTDCNNLVKQWLSSPESVTPEQLNSASNASYSPSSYAAATAAAPSSYAAATAAAAAASNAGSHDKEDVLEGYYQSLLANFSSFEKQLLNVG